MAVSTYLKTTARVQIAQGTEIMKCPVDGTLLTMSDRQGVEIDYCPTCRGVWLDRGELDKIIEMSQSVPVPAGPRGDARPAQSERDSRAHRDNERYDDRGDYDDEHDPRRRKRKSMLGELFDF
jgi:Zn-finger nucleic acid-binding protein